MSHSADSWYLAKNVDDVHSPALLVYPDRIEENIRRMIRLAGGTGRLRPHVKTHKLAEVVRMQLAHGITRFKCATIAELEMAAAAGSSDLLLAFQPVGPNAKRLRQLMARFPHIRFSAIADDAAVIRSLSQVFSASGLVLDLYLDVDCGMNRTGVAPGPAAIDLYRLIANSAGLKPAGFHAYDGHINHSDPAERTAACDNAYAPVSQLRREVENLGLPVPNVVAGGTPTFPIHARRTEVECSPGTCLFWDFSYADKLSDLDFLSAALVLARVVSKPGSNRLCLDLGHKAIAAENPHPRVRFFGLADATPVVHSEEHLVLETAKAGEFGVGDCLYGVPRHVCPTVALHAEAVVIRIGNAEERWKIAARNRCLTV